MIRKILTVLVLIPLGVVLVVLSVANRQPATLRLDPFNEIDPAIVFTLPLFVMVLLAVLVGMIIGAIAVWFSQGRHRRALKRQQAEAKRWRDEAEAQKKRGDTLAAQIAGTMPSGGAAPASSTGFNLPVKAA